MTQPYSTARLIASRQPGFSLPRELYCGEQALQDDLQQIWYREWVFAIPSCEIARTGSFSTLQLGEYPVIIVRGADGRVRAFHNVCRHRGQRLCPKTSGSSPKLVCPYHQWTYDLDGKLLYARDMGEGFDPSRYGLKPVHCADIGGMIFVCVAPVPPSLADLAQNLMRYVGPSALAESKVAHSSTIIEKGNWKLVLENNRECYHCGGSHPSLCRTYSDDPLMTVMEGPNAASPEILAHWDRCDKANLPSRFVHGDNMQWRLARVPLMDDAESFTMSGKAAVSRRMGTIPWNDAGALMFYHFPSSWNHFLPDHAIVFRILPISPTETEVTTKWLVHKDAVEGEDYDLQKLTEVWLATNDEDRRVVEENQAGILSPAYEPGPYSPSQEAGVIHLVDWYCATMTERLGLQTAAE
ncbi:aromatic ring-hydroxylating oxygenase subunit alpha [Paracoccus seriniphilus]|uniref:Rieske 2Fe-2S family protein n=1 Tax=Paracoccus seriniphilus TaxID=184748 RepID=A0A239PY77_9RHOB|nr:aromatic ring-hydroxylating dioxygenase subunit alpha [Paracoccus seriniphilus]WCR14624.1 aromatic ring-hydroxylating dioxygenase subunit alpha [Paracoccus seriniphilus]SNT75234.1 Rieske 2Fe-2S family protein [Paracoccus seriniphilus]